MVVRGGVSSGTSRRTRNCCTGCRGASWVDDNQVAGCGRVNRTLDRTRGGNVRRGFAANGDRNGINGLAAVSCRNHQFAAPGCGLTPLLHGARKIGRASCRERVSIAEGEVSRKKKTNNGERCCK